ncbi:MAG: heavy-metal-associated domain-containing protein [Oscillospiraceae bacterium]|nr:heavy-metal-associated domain-containing protein [Oscillospiraceae bacterium]
MKKVKKSERTGASLRAGSLDRFGKLTIVLVMAMLLCFSACVEDKNTNSDGSAVKTGESQEPEALTIKTVISVDGMTCGNCIAAITRELSKIEGIIDFDVKIGKVTVEHESDVSVADLKEAIMAAGYNPIDS